ncbi:type IV secretion system protein VirB3 [Parasulfitobacter algicola]|uniref:Type IV secretion system protein VirB3 n=1 Tax=Parasulfitobacter algicola TaxID=2614809 RepID=A0ABX2IV61_9RHOB|nr:type IV secretion system protein VirB3 [Sulfitobacter algicola]NSX56793.1 type IV secretion system protein VirB3 [Sulfitobacter algicola]
MATSNKDETINEDKVFLALTRPAMFYGVPFEAALLCVLIAGLAMILTDNIFFLSIFIPLFFVSKFIVKNDANAFRILFRFLETKAKCVNRSIWGGSSTSPLRVTRKYKIEECD